MSLPEGVQVDDQDLERVLAVGRWFVIGGGYVMANGRMRNRVRERSVYLHRFIMCCTHGDGLHVDHDNHDKLDNRRSNLIVGTRARNMQNQLAHRDAFDPVRGLSFDKVNQRWVAERMVDGRRKRRTFTTREAALAGLAELRA